MVHENLVTNSMFSSCIQKLSRLNGLLLEEIFWLIRRTSTICTGGPPKVCKSYKVGFLEKLLGNLAVQIKRETDSKLFKWIYRLWLVVLICIPSCNVKYDAVLNPLLLGRVNLVLLKVVSGWADTRYVFTERRKISFADML